MDDALSSMQLTRTHTHTRTGASIRPLIHSSIRPTSIALSSAHRSGTSPHLIQAVAIHSSRKKCFLSSMDALWVPTHPSIQHPISHHLAHGTRHGTPKATHPRPTVTAKRNCISLHPSKTHTRLSVCRPSHVCLENRQTAIETTDCVCLAGAGGRVYTDSDRQKGFRKRQVTRRPCCVLHPSLPIAIACLRRVCASQRPWKNLCAVLGCTVCGAGRQKGRRARASLARASIYPPMERKGHLVGSE